MAKTKTVFILGIILMVVIIGLIIYAYQTTQLTAPAETNQQNNLDDNSTKEPSSNPTEIKEKMKTVEQKALEEMDCEDEIAQEYQKKVETGKVSTAQGTVLAIKVNSLTVKFNQGSIEWQANVKINQDTLIAIPASISNPQTKEIPFTDLKQNDSLVVNISEDKTIINNQDFTAGSIFKLE